MKEQVVTPRAGRAPGRGRTNGVAQRPSRRTSPASGSGKARASSLDMKRVLAYVPLASKILLAVVVGVVLFMGYRAASSASFFRVKSIDIEGTSRASAENIREIVRRSVGATGVWKADINTLSEELKRQPWVRSVVVSRVLPSGMRVRVAEREPRAVVRTSSGRLVWIDEDGVMLGALAPTDPLPPFFIRGWDESGTELAREENRARVAKYLELLSEWESAGLTRRISELNLDDMRDVRAQLSGDDSEVEVRFVGKENVGRRLGRALEVLDEMKDSSRRAVSYLYVKADGSVTVGLGAGAQQESARTPAEEQKAKTPAQTPAPVAVKKKETAPRDTRAASDDAQKRRPRTVEASGRERVAAERPRRVT